MIDPIRQNETPTGPEIPSASESADAEADPRRDPMAPPNEPCECFCLHCRRTFMSNEIWFQIVKGAKDGFPGFWRCPTPNCDGAGFTFDIFPTDPTHPANEGWVFVDDDEEEEYDPESDDTESNEADSAVPDWVDPVNEEEEEWDPAETKYSVLDEMEPDDDLEGEEWKLGLQPGERPQAEAWPPGISPSGWEEEEAMYDQPDQRPREVDWSELDEQDRGPAGPMGEHDIPF